MNIPRFNRHPIDTFIYGQMIKRITPRQDKVGKIRAIITKHLADPYTDPAYRGKKYVKARQFFLYFVYKYAEFSQEAAASLLNKDHATTFHSIKCVNNHNEREEDYFKLFKLIESEVKLIK